MVRDISDIEVLKAIVSKAYCIECQMELSTQWDAFGQVKEKHRDLLFKLAHESATHKSMLMKWISNIEGLDLKSIEAEMVAKDFDFSHLMDEEILSEILKYDRIALELYNNLYKYTNKEFINTVLKEGTVDDYFNDIGKIIKDEEVHVEMLKGRAGGIERIR